MPSPLDTLGIRIKLSQLTASLHGYCRWTRLKVCWKGPEQNHPFPLDWSCCPDLYRKLAILPKLIISHKTTHLQQCDTPQISVTDEIRTHTKNP
jgi:hypothetical protein